MCARVYVCIYVIGKKKQKKRSMALELAEFEFEVFGRQKSLWAAQEMEGWMGYVRGQVKRGGDGSLI